MALSVARAGASAMMRPSQPRLLTLTLQRRAASSKRHFSESAAATATATTSNFNLKVGGGVVATLGGLYFLKDASAVQAAQLVPAFGLVAVGQQYFAGNDLIGRAVKVLPSIAQDGYAHLEFMFTKKPLSVAGAGGFFAVSGIWLALTAWDWYKAGTFNISFGGGAVAAPTGDGANKITPVELAKHNTDADLWIAIDGKVYDVTPYFMNHPAPAGPGVIQKNAGQDATHGFKAAKHSPHAVSIRDKHYIGELERDLKQELAAVYNCDDMQKRAKELLNPGALAYYDAGAEDYTSCTEALECWDRDWRLRPRNFIDVSEVSTKATVLGHTLEVPILAAPTALLKMGHEDGENAVARGVHMMGAGNCLSTTASLSLEEVAAAEPNCYRWFQLYVYKDHEMTKRLVQRADQEGYSAIVFTVDLPVLGNRTSLKRIGFTVPKEFKMANVVKEQEQKKEEKKEEKKDDGVDKNAPGDRAKYINKLYDQSLTLELLDWMKEITDKPIVVKGILRGDSAALCAAYENVRGIVVSNHGGRQLDNCLAPLTALPDVVDCVNKVNIERAKKGWEPVEVYVDGGIKRGRDIFKALALGAKACMVGRPMIYGMAVGGDLGVARTVELLRDELKTVMQLAGAQSTEQIDRTFIVRSKNRAQNDEALDLEAGTDEAFAWNGYSVQRLVAASEQLIESVGGGAQLQATAKEDSEPYAGER